MVSSTITSKSVSRYILESMMPRSRNLLYHLAKFKSVRCKPLLRATSVLMASSVTSVDELAWGNDIL